MPTNFDDMDFGDPFSAPARTSVLPQDDYTQGLDPWLRRGAQGNLPEYDPSLSFLFEDTGPMEQAPAETYAPIEGAFVDGTQQQALTSMPLPPVTDEAAAQWEAAQPSPGEAAIYEAGVAADEDARLRRLGIRDDSKVPIGDHPPGEAILAQFGRIQGAPPPQDPFAYLGNAGLRESMVAQAVGQQAAGPPEMWNDRPRLLPNYFNVPEENRWRREMDPEFLRRFGFGTIPVLRDVNTGEEVSTEKPSGPGTVYSEGEASK